LSGFDSDRSYELDANYKPLPVVQQPIDPPYKEVMEKISQRTLISEVRNDENQSKNIEPTNSTFTTTLLQTPTTTTNKELSNEKNNQKSNENNSSAASILIGISIAAVALFVIAFKSSRR